MLLSGGSVSMRPETFVVSRSHYSRIRDRTPSRCVLESTVTSPRPPHAENEYDYAILGAAVANGFRLRMGLRRPRLAHPDSASRRVCSRVAAGSSA
jgi:hypothetical protein